MDRDTCFYLVGIRLADQRLHMAVTNPAATPSSLALLGQALSVICDAIAEYEGADAGEITRQVAEQASRITKAS